MSSDRTLSTERTVLVAIPAYNEAATLGRVVHSVRENAPEFDVVVVNDGSRDGTSAVVGELGVDCLEHLCNLGYGRTLQTALIYAKRRGYRALITFDGDGQHHAEDLRPLHRVFCERKADLVIGSRFVADRRYASGEQSRVLGMWVFSLLVKVLGRMRIYDTTSGFRVYGADTFDLLTSQPFADFHAEAIVLLLRHGFSVSEHRIQSSDRTSGVSMYTALSSIKYPLKTSLMAILAFLGTGMAHRR